MKNRHLSKILSVLCAVFVLIGAFYLPFDFSAEAAVIPVTDDETVVFSFEKDEDPVVIHDQDKNFTRGNDGVGITGWSMNVFSADGPNQIGRVRAVGKKHTNPVSWSDPGGYRLNNKKGVYNLEPNSTYVVSLKLRVVSGPKSYTGYTVANTTEVSLGYGFLGVLDGVNNPVNEMKTVVSKIFSASTDSNTYTVYNEAGETVYEVGDGFNEFTYVFTTPENLGEGVPSLGIFANCWYGTEFMIDDVSVTKVGSANGVALLIDEFSGTVDVVTGAVGTDIALEDKTSDNPDVSFSGWYCDKEFTTVASDAKIQPGKQVFYAKWRAPVSITFVDTLNNTENTVTGFPDDVIEIPSDPVDGVNEPDQQWFMGWYTTEAYTEEWKATTFGQSNYKVYSKWMGVIEDEVEDFENYISHLDKATRPGDFNDIVYNNHLYFSNTMDIVDSENGKALEFDWDSSMKKDNNDPETYDATTKYSAYDNMALLEDVALLENTAYKVTFDYYVEEIGENQTAKIFPINAGEGNIWGPRIDFRLTNGVQFDITADSKDGNWHKGGFDFTMKYSEPTTRALFLVVFLSENSDVKLYIDNVKFEAVQPYQSTVTYVHNNGDSDIISIGNRGEEIPSYVPSKSGLTFDGWYLDKELTVPFTTAVFGKENVVVYAKWSGELVTFDSAYKWYEKNELVFGRPMSIKTGDGAGYDDNFALNLNFEGDKEWGPDMWTGEMTYWRDRVKSVRDNTVRITKLKDNTAYKIGYYYKAESNCNTDVVLNFATNTEGNAWDPEGYKNYVYTKQNINSNTSEWKYAETYIYTELTKPEANMLYVQFEIGANADQKGIMANVLVDHFVITELSDSSSVIYVLNNGDVDKIVVGKRGEAIPEYVPSKNGLTFMGWYADKELTTKFEQNTFGENGITVYAKWSGELVTFDGAYKWYEKNELVFGRPMSIKTGDGAGYDDNYALNFSFDGDKEWGPDMWTGKMTYWRARVKAVRDNTARIAKLKNDTAYKISYYYKSNTDCNVDVIINFATNTEGNAWDPDGYKNYDYTAQPVACKSYEWQYAETYLFVDAPIESATMLYIQHQVVASSDKLGIYANVDVDRIVITEYEKPYVYFDGQNKSYAELVAGKPGEAIQFPANPVKVGYTFTGWFLDKECTKPFTATTFAEGDCYSVYAGYVKSDDVLYTFENFNYEEYPGWFLWDEGCERVKTDITVSGEHALRFDRDLKITNNGRSGFICVGDDIETFKIDPAKKYVVTFNYYIEKQGSKDASVTFRSGSENNYWHFVTDVSGKHTISFAEKTGEWNKAALVVDGTKMTQTEHVCLYVAMDGGDGGVFYVDDIYISVLPDGHNAYVVDNKNCPSVPLYITGAVGSSFLNKLPSSPKMNNYYFGGYSIVDENGNIKELSAENAVFTDKYAKIIANFVRLETLQNFESDNYKSLLGSFGEYTTIDFDYELYDSAADGNSKEGVTSGRYSLHRKGETYFFENAQVLTADLPLSNAERYTLTMKVKLGKHLQSDGAIKIASCKSLYYPWDTTGDYHAIVAIKDLLDGEWHEITYTFNSVEMYLSIQTPGYCELFIDDVKLVRVDKNTEISANVEYTEYVPAKRDANGNLLEIKPTDIDIGSIVDASLYVEDTNVLPFIIIGGVSVAVIIIAVVLVIVFKKRKNAKI